MQRNKGVLRVTIADDGKGFTEGEGARTAKRGGWGLPAMRERAEALGGAISVRSGAGGTCVVVEIPLADEN